MTDAFRTDFSIPKAPFTLNANSRVLTLGSCFSEVIGYKLQQYKVKALINSFGTIFNPVSAGQLLEAAAGQDIDIENRLVERDGLWYAYDLHSSFAAASQENLLADIEKSMAETAEFLKQTDLLILTFGTAMAYRLKITGEIVANCHKVPANQFDREMLTPDDIVTAMFSMHAALREINPALKIVLTVSPVRHVKESMVVNSASKAALRVACHYLSETLPDVSYFPSFELMMDDLRDYRFYKADMLHPTEVAENYIWQKFINAYFDDAFRNFLPEWDKIKRALSHKPFQPEAPGHQQFLKDLLRRLENLHPRIDCSAEIRVVKEQLIQEPEAPSEKGKKKKQKAGRKEKATDLPPVTAEASAVAEAAPETVALPEPPVEAPAPEEPETEITTPTQPVPEKPALTKAELEAIANRPIVPAKPWISAKEKAEARKKERAALQAAKQTAKKEKAKKKKAPALASLLAGVRTVAETKPADQEKPEVTATPVSADKIPAAEIPAVPEKPVTTEKPVKRKKPASKGKPVKPKQQLNSETPDQEQPVTKVKQPAKRKPKPKPVAKKQPKPATQESPELRQADQGKQVTESAPKAVETVPERPAAASQPEATKPVVGGPAAVEKAKPVKKPKAPAKPKKKAPSRKKAVAAPEPAAAPEVKKAQPKKPAVRKKAAEIAEKPKAKPRGKKEPKAE